MRQTKNEGRRRGAVAAGAGLVGMLLFTPGASEAQSATDAVTFAKDVAPIFQQKCQECHRPDSMAPMSLLTYEESRPWARSIKARVVGREMPPWFLDKTIGIQEFINDISLTEEEIDTIVRWVDSGAPAGDYNFPDSIIHICSSLILIKTGSAIEPVQQLCPQFAGCLIIDG